MEKQSIATYAYGAANNGATISFLPELNCILIEWKGDVLLEEWIEVLTRCVEEVSARSITNWISDDSNLGTIGEEHNQWGLEVLLPKVTAAGVKKGALVLPNDVVGEISHQELMESVESISSNNETALQSMYFKHMKDAIEWIKA